MRTSQMAPILLIEDDPDMRALVASLLADEGAVVLYAYSGHEGLAKLQATAEHMVVVSSGVLQDMSVADMLHEVVRDGGLARRHAFVLVTPEPDAIALASAWQGQVLLFTVLEPYSRDELLAAVSRAAQCVALTRTLYSAPGAGRPDRSQVVHDDRDAAMPAATSPLPRVAEDSPAGSARVTTRIVVVGGEQGIRRLITGVLSHEPYVVSHTADEQVALTWLRACPEAMLVVINSTGAQQYADLMRAAVDDARLVRHTYVLMVPAGLWLSPPQRELVGVLNAPIVHKPFSPIAFRQTIEALAGPPVAVWPLT